MFNVGDKVLAKEDGFPDVIGPIVSIDFDRDWPIRVRTEKADIGFKPEQLTAVSAQQAVGADPTSPVCKAVTAAAAQPHQVRCSLMTELKEPQRILTTAIETWQPVALVSLFSGGYDSMITTHVLHRLNTHGLSIQVWAIDTKLAADGWTEYVKSVAAGFGWNFQIYDNQKGFGQFVECVRQKGCPRTKAMHTYVFQKLKERGFDAILMMNKTSRRDKVLFVSGMRRSESTSRQNADEVSRIGKSNKIFAAPIVHWSNEECDYYRVEYALPDNPFYNTVKGSGDCQCNWGNFINMRTLQRYSPNLAAGNVATIDQISRDLHGYGWDGEAEGQQEFLKNYDGEANLTSPFLCANCSRAKHRVPARIVENRILQAGLF